MVMGGESDGAGGIHHVLFLTTNNTHMVDTVQWFS